MQGAREAFLAQGHDHLDDAGDARGGLGVADVGLDRAEPQGLLAVAAVSGGEGVCLDGVAEPGARAVGLDGVDVGGAQTGAREGLADDALLGGAAGGRQAVGGAVLVDGAAADHGEDVTALAPGLGQRHQDEHAGALAERESVGPRGERLAAAVGCEGPLAGELGEHLQARQDRRAAGEGGGRGAAAQGLAGEVEGDQGGGAGGVDGEGGALQAEGVGDTAGGDADGVAGQDVAGDVGGGGGGGAVVVGRHEAEVDAGRRAAQGRRVDARPLQRLPCRLQQQPLLRVHGEGLAGADAEEGGVEVGGVAQESAFALEEAAGCGAAGVVASLDVPAPVVGQRGDGVGAVQEELPQGLGRVGVAGEAAGHADDGDGLVGVRVTAGGVQVGGGRAVELFVEVVAEGRGGRVVEGGGRGEGQSGRGAQTVPEGDGGGRFEALVAEGHLRGRAAGQLEQAGHLGADEIDEVAAPVRFGQVTEAVAQGGRLHAEGCAESVGVLDGGGVGEFGGQVGRVGGGVVQGGPFGVSAGRPVLGHGALEAVGVSGVPAQSGVDGAGDARPAEDGFQTGGEQRVRADLQEVPVAGVQCGADGGDELDGVAQGGGPVVPVEGHSVEGRAGRSGVQGDAGRARGEVGEVGADAVGDLVDVR
ncbi:hypothetical protein GCM10010344_76160 [Streptomyces bluensis]|nr:hypothetical protein GCM10010344_76160 [Streptomyces bluensis]